MPETKAISYTFKELAEILVKERGIHEGFWGISLDFALAAGLVPFPPTDATNLAPSAIVPVTKIGIRRFDEPNSLTVDAVKVNPLPEGEKLGKPEASAAAPPVRKKTATKAE